MGGPAPLNTWRGSRGDAPNVDPLIRPTDRRPALVDAEDHDWNEVKSCGLVDEYLGFLKVYAHDPDGAHQGPVARVTLSRQAIATARALMIAVTGDAKRKVIEDAIKEGAGSPYPIGRVLADVELPVDIHWAA